MSTRYFAATGDSTPFDSRWLSGVSVIQTRCLCSRQEQMVGGYMCCAALCSVKFGDGSMWCCYVLVVTRLLILVGLTSTSEPDPYGYKSYQPAKRCGLSKSPYRPSDDATLWAYVMKYCAVLLSSPLYLCMCVFGCVVVASLFRRRQ